MPAQKIIRNEPSLDRFPFRVTAEDVFEVAMALQGSFTTGDIAALIFASGEHQGVSYYRIERSVRTAIDWLVKRDIAYTDGAIVKFYRAGNKGVKTYMLREGRRWNKTTRQAEIQKPDYALLNFVFLRS